MDPVFLTFIVTREHVKRVKSALEDKNMFNRATRIHTAVDTYDCSSGDSKRFVVPTSIEAPRNAGNELVEDELPEETKRKILRDMGLQGLQDVISIITYTPSSQYSISRPAKGNPLLTAVSSWLQTVPPDLLVSLDITTTSLLSAFPATYSIYKPMLLLPAHTFRPWPWTSLISALQHTSSLQTLYSALAAATSVTHVALNAPIPLQSKSHDSLESENILRRPTSLTALHGSFGPLPCPNLQYAPQPHDFAAAFWVSTRQNNIHQIWAPLYTMFSRGNVSEKARLLDLPSVTDAVRQGEETEHGCTAVDLYAGIGYFAFSYKKAGATQVLCWELNPWSVEGLRRGASLNGWSSYIINPSGNGKAEEEAAPVGRETDFLVFQESNEFAIGRIQKLRNRVPPIRHVNCGLLPSSRGSWATAVRAADPLLGGWVHLHENIGIGDIEGKRLEIVREVQEIFEEEVRIGRGTYDAGDERMVKLEHVEKVKTYAPGVMHCVLDIYIPPKEV